MNIPRASIFFLILIIFAGCTGTPAPKFANVKGNVTFNGKPIEKGQITFFMEGYTPKTMEIIDGAFTGQAMVGNNKIAISAMKKSANAPKISKEAQNQIGGYQKKFKESSEGAGSVSEYDPTAVDYIPAEWGSQSKETRMIEPGQTNEMEINIKGKTP